jgi:hypothetical protein
MAFSGGGSNILKPHTHDSTILQDGGNLDFDNVTQGDLAAGDVVYSDGVHMQKLAIGTPAQQLQVNAGATAPTWSSEHEQGKLELLNDSELGADGTSLVADFSATPLNMETVYGELYLIVQGWAASTTDIGLKINDHTDYDLNRIMNDSGTVTGAHLNANTTYELISSALGTTSDTFSAICSIKRIESGEGGIQMAFDASGGYAVQGNQITQGYDTTAIADSEIDKIEIISTSNMDKGVRLTIWGRRV